MNGSEQESQIARTVESAIRLAAIGLMAFWVFQIVRPFLSPILWGVIIAVAAFPIYTRLARLCGGRTTLAAVLFSGIGLALLITPTVLLTEALVGWIEGFAARVEDGSLDIPQPPASLQEWPILGNFLHQRWSDNAAELQTALRTPGAQLKSLNEWLLSSAAAAGSGVLQFVLSLLIAGAVLANSKEGSDFIERLFVKLAPEIGHDFASLAEQTVRSVATGVIGVALIQSLLLAVGLFAIGAPAAPLIVLVCLILGVVQLPVLIGVAPALVWAWTSTDTLPAVLFTIWTVAAAASDNVLKPILLGRGVEAPMLVIFLGAIGGFVTSGIIGLFVGAVVLVLAYQIVTVWLAGAGELEARVEALEAERPAS